MSSFDRCPSKIDAELAAVLDAVAAAPPPQFSGGGKWEAMHGSMGGWHEIRLTGPGREQFRLFCLLENADDDELLRRGLTKPAIAVITGMSKPWRTKFSEADYRRVQRLGDEHKANRPRRIAPIALSVAVVVGADREDRRALYAGRPMKDKPPELAVTEAVLTETLTTASLPGYEYAVNRPGDFGGLIA